MSDLLTPMLAGNDSPAPEWLQARRLAGKAAWQNQALPTRKTENWKYTSLYPLQQEFQAAAANSQSAEQLGLQLPDFAGSRLVFVDGHYRADLSSLKQEDALELVRFADASDEQAEAIARHLGTAVASDKHLFSLLNDAALNDGVFMRVKANQKLEQTVHIVWFNSEQELATSNQRFLCVAEANSEATVIEHFAGHGQLFTNGISELLLQPGAKLRHSRLHLEGPQALHIGGVHARLDRDSTLSSFHLALGSSLKRVDIVIDHQGPGAHCDLDGIYLLRGQEHVDYHSTIEHAVPHCTTDENFRGIVGDKARAVFNGRIHIHPDAQKTRAELNNKNLLTSVDAEVNTKPELEIYADDVACAHGATVAQLDETMLHYLRTRGIPADEATVILSYGFINTLVEAQPLQALREFLEPLLADYFSNNQRLTQHLG